MKMNFETIIWFIFLLDAAVNVVFSRSNRFNEWYKKNFPRVSGQFPLALGWSLLYLGMVIWVGVLIYRLQSNWSTLSRSALQTVYRFNALKKSYFLPTVFLGRNPNCGLFEILWNLKLPVCMVGTQPIQPLSQEQFLFTEHHPISSKTRNMLPSFLRFKSWVIYILVWWIPLMMY